MLQPLGEISDIATLKREQSGMAALFANGRELLDILVNHDDLISLRDRLFYERRRFDLQLRRGALISFALMFSGLLIGRAGTSLVSWSETAGSFFRDFGWLLRAIGTLWAAIGLGVVTLKATIVVHGLQFTSAFLADTRRRFLNAASDSSVVGALWPEGELLSQERATRIKNGLFALYLWIVTLGIFTLIPWVFAIDVSLQAFLSLMCACIVVIATSVYLGSNTIALARLVNFAVLIVLLGYFFKNSPAGAFVLENYHDTDFYKQRLEEKQRQAKVAASKRVLVGTDKLADQTLLGPAYADMVKLRQITSKLDADACDKEAALKLEKRVNAYLNGQVTTENVPDCEKLRAVERATAAELERKKNALHRVLVGKSSERRGDRGALGAVYRDAVEIRTLAAKPNKDDCHRMRLDVLNGRVDAFVNGDDYSRLIPQDCPEPEQAVEQPSTADTEANPVPSGPQPDLAKAARAMQAAMENPTE